MRMQCALCLPSLDFRYYRYLRFIATRVREVIVTKHCMITECCARGALPVKMNLAVGHINLSTILLTIAVFNMRRGADCRTYNEVKYDFRYAINEPSSGVIMDQWENRYGEFVKGAYSMLDADGKIRTVHYEVDGRRGFHAIVKRKYPGSPLIVSHLLYPKKYRVPYQHAKPVSLITKDLFDSKVRPYPNLPDT